MPVPIPGDVPLTPALEAVFARADGDDPDHRILLGVLETGARAIHALGTLDLHAFEAPELGPADLSVWEALAPKFQRVAGEVYQFVTRMKELLPDEAMPEGREPNRAEQAIGVVDAITMTLSRALGEFSRDMHKPAIMADRWSLLYQLTSFHGQCRQGMGEAVFEAARVFTLAPRDAVVPGLADDIDEALRLRGALARLGVRLNEANASAGEGSDIHTAAGRALEEVDAFVHGPAWRLLRPLDKRGLLESRQSLQQALGPAPADAMALAHALEGVDRFLDAVGMLNRRLALKVHDEALSAELLERLERAEAHITATSPDELLALDELSAALQLADPLLGCDRELDRFILADGLPHLDDGAGEVLLTYTRTVRAALERARRDAAP